MEEKRVIEISTRTIVKIFLILGFVLIGLLLKDVFILVLIAFILAMALNPFVDRLGKKLPRGIAVLVLYSLIGAVLFFMIKLIVPTVAEQINFISRNSQLYIEGAHKLSDNASPELQKSIKSLVSDIPNKLRDISINGILNKLLGIFSGIVGFITIVVLTFYFLLDKEGIEKTLQYYLPEDYKKRGMRVYRKISRNMSLWLRGQILLSLAIGIISYIGLTVIGIEFALTLAVWAAFTEFIPVIGPIIGGIPALMIALATSPSKALSVLIFYVSVQFLEGHFLVPQVMKKALGLSPAFVIISILTGARLFGILGVLLALPVASALSVLIEEIHEYDNIS